MPRSAVSDAEHVVYTDHSIPRRPITRNKKPDATAPLVAFGEVAASSRDQGLAYAITALREQNATYSARAFDLLRDADKHDPNDTKTLSYLADLYKSRKEDQTAEKLFQNQPPATAANVCLPASSPLNDVFPEPKRFVQTPQLLVILYEGDIPRQIHMDGRALPVDPQPAWVGYSIGKWEGDTLVVQTAGFNSRAPLDFSGHLRSESMRMTERMRRRDFGHLDTQVTIDDPTFYSKPITFRYTATLVPDDDLLEAVCAENERDGVHLKP